MEIYLLHGDTVRTCMYFLDCHCLSDYDTADDAAGEIADRLDGLTRALEREDPHTCRTRVQLSYHFLNEKRLQALLDLKVDKQLVICSLVRFLSEVSRPPDELFATVSPKQDVRPRVEALGRNLLTLVTKTEALACLLRASKELLDDSGDEPSGESPSALAPALKLFGRLLHLTELFPERQTLYSLVWLYMNNELDKVMDKAISSSAKEDLCEPLVSLLRSLFKHEAGLLEDCMPRPDDIGPEADSADGEVDDSMAYQRMLKAADFREQDLAPEPERDGRDGDDSTMPGLTASDACFALYEIANGLIPNCYCELSTTLLAMMTSSDRGPQESLIDEFLWLHKTMAKFCLEQPFMAVRSLLKIGTLTPVLHCAADLTDYVKRSTAADDLLPVPERLNDGILMVQGLVRLLHRLRCRRAIAHALYCDIKSKLLYKNDLINFLVSCLCAHRVVQWPRLLIRSMLITCARLNEFDDTYSGLSSPSLFIQRDMMVVYAEILSTYAHNCALLDEFVVRLLLEAYLTGDTIRVFFVPELIAVFTDVVNNPKLPKKMVTLIGEALAYYQTLSHTDEEDLQALLHGGVYDEEQLMDSERTLYLCKFFLKHDSGKRDLPLVDIQVDMARVGIYLSSGVVLSNLFTLRLIGIRRLAREQKRLSTASAEHTQAKLETLAECVDVCKQLGLFGYLAYVQSFLLNFCSTKLKIQRGDLDAAVCSPLLFHHIRFSRNVPILPHSPSITSMLASRPVRALLGQLGFLLDEDFHNDVTLPECLSPRTVYNQALSLGDYVVDLFPELTELGEMACTDDLGLTDDLIAEFDALDDKDLFATAQASEGLMSFDWDVMIKSSNQRLSPSTSNDASVSDLSPGNAPDPDHR